MTAPRHWFATNGVPHDAVVERHHAETWAMVCSCGMNTRVRSRSAAIGLLLEHRARTLVTPPARPKQKPKPHKREQMPTRRFEL